MTRRGKGAPAPASIRLRGEIDVGVDKMVRRGCRVPPSRFELCEVIFTVMKTCCRSMVLVLKSYLLVLCLVGVSRRGSRRPGKRCDEVSFSPIVWLVVGGTDRSRPCLSHQLPDLCCSNPVS